MAGEIITATTLEEGKEELRGIYRLDTIAFKEITKEEYEAIERDEREDSDNHLNIKKLGKEASVIDLAHYKYLPDRKIAYRIILKHKNGTEMKDYFMLTPGFS
jgi:hypothetical protein